MNSAFTINNLATEYWGIFLLMFTTFLVGYFAAFFLQKNYYSKTLKKLQRQAEFSKMNKNIADIETIFTEIKPKIVEVVKEQNKIYKHQEVRNPEAIAQQTRTSYLNYTKNKPQLNFKSIGSAQSHEKDVLTKINGIGPYIEQRLNEIGIYNYQQISKLTEEDIRVLTELIDFFPGRIERDNWVAQAQALLQYQS